MFALPLDHTPSPSTLVPAPAVEAGNSSTAVAVTAVSADISFSIVLGRARGGGVACFEWPAWALLSTANDIFSASVELAFVLLTSTSDQVERLWEERVTGSASTLFLSAVV